MPAILQTAPFGRSGTLPGRGRMIPAPVRVQEPGVSGLQVEPDHVAGAVRGGGGVPGEGEGVEQLEAATGDRGRAGAVAVEGQGGAAVPDLDVEQVGAEGD